MDILIGQRLRERRKELGMSQRQLGEMMGVSNQQLQKYENAENRIAASRLFKVALLLDRPMGWFFCQ